MTEEMLKRLIGAGVVNALPHRAHRLAPTVAQQPGQIPAKRAALRDVSERALERLEPRAQTIEPRRCIARQQHRASAYRNGDRSTRRLTSIPSDLGTNPWI